MCAAHDLEPFNKAIQSGDDRALQHLLQQAPPDVLTATFSETPTTFSVGRGFTLLQLAAFRRWRGRPARVLVQHGAIVDFHAACGMGPVTRVRAQLNSGADGTSAIDTCVPLQFAIASGRATIVSELLTAREDPQRDLPRVCYFLWEHERMPPTPWKPIHMATLWNYYDSSNGVLAALCDAGANPESASPLHGFRPLHLAAMSGNASSVRWLLQHGANVDSRTPQVPPINDVRSNDGPITGHDCTPLMVAAAEGWAEYVNLLLTAGADPAATNSQGHSALTFAQQAHWPGSRYDNVIDQLTA